jgi:hypothetical protein
LKFGVLLLLFSAAAAAVQCRRRCSVPPQLFGAAAAVQCLLPPFSPESFIFHCCHVKTCRTVILSVV